MTDTPIDFHDEPAAAGPVTCVRCHAPLTQYWSVDGRVVCERCAGELQAERRSSKGAVGRVMRALALGSGGMIAGALVWYGVAAYSGWQLGVIAILLGWLVGKGVQYGSGRRTGIGYQIMAVVITYLGIGFASLPFFLQEGARLPLAADTAAVRPAADSSVSSDSAQFAALDSSLAEGRKFEEEARSNPVRLMWNFFVGFVSLILVLVLSLPVLTILNGGSLLTGFIYAIALYEAWKFSRGVELVVSGPYQVGAAG